MFKKLLEEFDRIILRSPFWLFEAIIITVLICSIISSVNIHSKLTIYEGNNKILNQKIDQLNKQLQSAKQENLELRNMKSNFPRKYVGEFTVAHYCSCPKCVGKKQQVRTATGHIPKQGRTIAVDPKVIPLHSIVYIEGEGYFVAEDTGGAIKGKRIDMYLNSHDEALRRGIKRKKVYVMEG